MILNRIIGWENNSMNFRVAKTSDFDTILSIQKQVHQLHVNNRPDQYKKTESMLNKTLFEELLTSEEKEVFVVVDTIPIAYSIVTLHVTKESPIFVSKKILHINDFGVNQIYRGKGVGRYLFNKILDHSKNVEADTIELSVWEFNESAIKFYEEIGMNTKTRRMELIL